MIRQIAIALLALAAASPAQAELVSIGDAVPGQVGKSYVDLVRIFIPDLTLEGEVARGETVVPLRPLIEGYGGKPPASVELRTLEAVPLHDQGRDGTLILVELGPSDDRLEVTAILALFDDELRLVDAVDAGMGPRVSMDAPVRVSPSDDIVPVFSTFSNSAFSASLYAPVYLREGRFQALDQWTISTANGCGWMQFQDVDIVPEPTEGRGFWPVTVTITDTVENDITVSCPDPLPQPGTASASVTYRWDAKKQAYVAESDALTQFIKSRPDLY